VAPEEWAAWVECTKIELNQESRSKNVWGHTPQTFLFSAIFDIIISMKRILFHKAPNQSPCPPAGGTVQGKAFTLIELLVVIAIIGIISGFILVTMTGATNSATDGKRKTAISGLAKSISAYGTLNSNGFPTETNNPCNIGSNCTNLAAAIVPEYMGSLPTDPTVGTYYKYYSYGSNSFFVRSILSSGSPYTFSSYAGTYSSSTNLLSYGQEFNNASWGKVGVSVTPNLVVAPDGTLTGDKTIETNVTGTFYVLKEMDLADSTNMTFSVYVKAAERTYVVLTNIDNTDSYKITQFNLTTGAITASTHASASITSVGNGWYRCVVSYNTGIGGTAGQRGRVGIWNSIGTSTADYTGTTGYGLYIWGAQLETGNTVTPWIPDNN
jgi:prepilin-type N-terminal cleavage/methylation domain-containing protein